MLSFDKVSKVYFSPSGSTKRIVDEIAKNFELDNENFDLLSFDEDKPFENELVIVGMPVFDGRIPQLARERLMDIKGNGTKVIAVVNYGNLDYGDALFELIEILKENNFDVVGAALTVSQHSLFGEIASERPDNLDMQMLNEFAQKLIRKLKTGEVNEIFVAGRKPFQNHIKHLFDVNCDESRCVSCYDCAYTCPSEAISEDNPTGTDLDLCTRCSLCIHICGENARSFGGSLYFQEKENALNNDLSRKEIEFFI